LKAKIIAIPLLAAAALPVSAGAAHASTRPVAATSHTWILNDPDNGHGTPSEWAVDTIHRTVTVTRGAQAPAADCGLSSGACWAYTAALRDTGTFETIPGAGTPNQACAGCAGEKVKSPAVDGFLSGNYQISFYASSGTPKASLVAKVHDDHGQPANPPFTSSTWPKQFFPAGTSFGGAFGGPYSWTYTAVVLKGFLQFTVQQWVDSSANGDGNQPGDGNISG
jgi:hypothetical protein